MVFSFALDGYTQPSTLVADITVGGAASSFRRLITIERVDARSDLLEILVED